MISLSKYAISNVKVHAVKVDTTIAIVINGMSEGYIIYTYTAVHIAVLKVIRNVVQYGYKIIRNNMTIIDDDIIQKCNNHMDKY